MNKIMNQPNVIQVSSILPNSKSFFAALFNVPDQCHFSSLVEVLKFRSCRKSSLKKQCEVSWSCDVSCCFQKIIVWFSQFIETLSIISISPIYLLFRSSLVYENVQQSIPYVPWTLSRTISSSMLFHLFWFLKTVTGNFVYTTQSHHRTVSKNRNSQTRIHSIRGPWIHLWVGNGNLWTSTTP